jgi:FAD/FMN-containing dehydrogenase
MNAATVAGLDTTVLETQVRGQLIRAEDETYDQLRAVHNANIDRRPALIVRCVDVADVIAVVNFARDADLRLAVRGGGHSVPGYGTVDDGVVIDLSLMRGVIVDPQARIVTAQGGATWGDVDHATHAFGLAAPGGVVSTTGVGGLTLGGGLGHLTRRAGLSIDNLVSADVVTADGSFVRASEDENPDLFWALRGGGGNFGVVTAFTFRLHPVSIHTAGPMLWELEDAPAAMRMWLDVLDAAPDELNAVLAFLVVPPGPPFPEELHSKNMVGIVWSHSGSPEQAEEVLARVREAVPPAFELVGPMPHPVLQSLFDGISGPGNQNYWRGDFFREVSDGAIDVLVEQGAKVPTIFSGIHMYPVDGVAGRVPPDATAWNYRDARWAFVVFGADPSPDAFDGLKKWVVEASEAVRPFSEGAAYVNFMVDEGEEQVRSSYRDNYSRLAEIKKRYDPENLFSVNQNISPAT